MLTLPPEALWHSRCLLEMKPALYRSRREANYFRSLQIIIHDLLFENFFGAVVRRPHVRSSVLSVSRVLPELAAGVLLPLPRILVFLPRLDDLRLVYRRRVFVLKSSEFWTFFLLFGLPSFESPM